MGSITDRDEKHRLSGWVRAKTRADLRRGEEENFRTVLESCQYVVVQ